MIENWRAVDRANGNRGCMSTRVPRVQLTSFDAELSVSAVPQDLPRLRRLDGLDVAHLQCHAGTEYGLRVALGGAGRWMVVVSPPTAVRVARELVTRASAALFVEGDVCDAADLLGSHRLDVVETRSVRCAGCPASALGRHVDGQSRSVT